MTEAVAKPKRSKKWLWIAIAVVVVLVVIASASDDQPGGSAQVAQTAAPAPAMKVAAAEISRAYQENEAKAQLAYEGKSLEVSGKVKDIDLSLGDAPVIRLVGSGDEYGMGVNSAGKMTDVSIHGLTKEVAATLDKGKSSTFVCGAIQEIMGGPQLQECALAAR